MPDTAPTSDGDRVRDLLRALTGPTPGRAEARERLVVLHLPLVERCARRFAHRGEPHEDLVQVGVLALINVIDHFDGARDLEFTAYAVPSVLGEIKRHFRDKSWAVRVPRRLNELQARITPVLADLAQRLGRCPTAAEVAEELGCDLDDVVDALESGYAYAAISLDADPDSPGGSAEGRALLGTLGAEDAALAHVEACESVRPLLERLNDRQKQILTLRFFHHQTQTQIAEELGISQVHVSRVLAQTLTDLRRGLDDDDKQGDAEQEQLPSRWCGQPAAGPPVRPSDGPSAGSPGCSSACSSARTPFR